MQHRVPAVFATLVASAGAVFAQDWPAFRGPTGDGISTESSVPLTWSSTDNVRWKAPLPQPANGSAIVSNGRVFLICPLDREGKQRALFCFDREDGKRLWVRTVEFDKVMPTHRTNPYGGSTPAADGKRVVVWHASAGLHCYDFAGNKLWSRDLGEFRHRWGYGTSPVIHNGKVILHSGPGKNVFVAALDSANGKTIWKTDEPVQGDGQDNDEGRLMGSWCTPIVAGIGGETRIICSMSTRVVAYNPEDGRIAWTCAGLPCTRGDLVYSSPTIAGDVCMVRGGYDGPGIGIRIGKGEGDLTATHRLWRHPRRPSNCGSGVVVGGYVFMPDAGGVISCIDPATGDRLWSKRAAKGRIWGSIVLAGGQMYVMNQVGTTTVFKPNPKKLEIIATNELGEATNSTPAISQGELFLRTHEHLYCIANPNDATNKKVPRDH